MRCGCPHCEAFMVQEEDRQNACVCPSCGYRCNACLGTGTAMSREDILRLKNSDWFTPDFDAATDDEASAASDTFTAPERPDAPRGF